MPVDWQMPQTATPPETPKAAQAFLDYVEMGQGRSLRRLAELHVSQKLYKNSPAALRTIQKWSVNHHWQERLASAISAEADRKLIEAATLDADTFLKTSRHLNTQISSKTTGLELRDVVQVRESVRKPMPKGGTSVSVSLSIETRQVAERMAAELGINPDELIAEAEDIARREWTKA